ncbi:MAG: hypothetical protein JNM57_06240 [Cyclobacteriaceae bacterium]|nr:hypothetical protein [Cyclobacteriaceae bacterium]
MRGLLSIAFASLLLVETMLSSMGTLELAKVPALFDHYQEHKNENPALSFIAFVNLHYANTEHHEQDHHQHHELPFTAHHQHNGCVHQLFYTVPDLAFVFNAESTTRKNLAAYHAPAELARSTSIWQPPRLI